MKNIICDMHIHSEFSFDSTAEIESYCIKACTDGVDVICFTEHIDFNPSDDGYSNYIAKDFFATFLPLKERYKHDVTLLCGLEFSEPHLYRKELAEFSKLPYDFILGSVHYWYGDLMPRKMLESGITLEESYALYWNAILESAKAGGFDCVGHMDFPKRYYGELLFDNGKIHEICQWLVRNNICVEINTSSLRKNLTQALPDKELLSIYKACGGKYVTISSDSHKPETLAADNAYAKSLVSFFGFEEVIFRQRTRCRISE